MCLRGGTCYCCMWSMNCIEPLTKTLEFDCRVILTQKSSAQNCNSKRKKINSIPMVCRFHHPQKLGNLGSRRHQDALLVTMIGRQTMTRRVMAQGFNPMGIKSVAKDFQTHRMILHLSIPAILNADWILKGSPCSIVNLSGVSVIQCHCLSHCLPS